MARRAEFYFDEKTGYYRKRVKLSDGRWKDVRGKTKEELRAKLSAAVLEAYEAAVQNEEAAVS